METTLLDTRVGFPRGNMRSFALASLATICLAMAACTTDGTLTYAPTSAAVISVAPIPVIASVTSLDQRKESPKRLATIMGGYGNPLKILDTTSPVSDEVAKVFAQALEQRGLLRTGVAAPYRMKLIVHRFDADQYLNAGARTNIDMQILDQTGRIVYQDSAQTSNARLQLFKSGIFASITELQKMAQDVLDAAVDQLIDKVSFRAAIQGAVSVPVS